MLYYIMQVQSAYCKSYRNLLNFNGGIGHRVYACLATSAVYTINKLIKVMLTAL